MTTVGSMGARAAWRGLLIAVAALALSPASAAADCESSAAGGAWPSFRATSPYAASVVLGHVDAYLAVERAGNVTRFRMHVDEVLRGAAPGWFDFRVPIAPPIPSCGEGPLSVELGDALALALDSSDAVDPAVVAVAIVDDAPGAGSVAAPGPERPGPERLTLTEVRAIAAQPASPWPILALSGAILGAFLMRPSWRRLPRSRTRQADG